MGPLRLGSPGPEPAAGPLYKTALLGPPQLNFSALVAPPSFGGFAPGPQPRVLLYFGLHFFSGFHYNTKFGQLVLRKIID